MANKGFQIGSIKRDDQKMAKNIGLTKGQSDEVLPSIINRTIIYIICDLYAAPIS